MGPAHARLPMASQAVCRVIYAAQAGGTSGHGRTGQPCPSLHPTLHPPMMYVCWAVSHFDGKKSGGWFGCRAGLVVVVFCLVLFFSSTPVPLPPVLGMGVCSCLHVCVTSVIACVELGGKLSTFSYLFEHFFSRQADEMPDEFSSFG